MAGIYQIKRPSGAFMSRQTAAADLPSPNQPEVSSGYIDASKPAATSPNNGTFNVCSLWKPPTQGKGFSQGNPVHKVFCIESEVVPTERIEKAYGILTKILKRVGEHLDKNPALTPPEKLKAVYVIMDEMGIKLEDQEDALFTNNLVNKKLDCDTSAFVMMALAFEFGWPLRLIVVSNHAFIRWQDNKNQFNIDQGLILPNWYYRWSFGLSGKDLSGMSSSYLAHALTNRAYYNIEKLHRFIIALKDLDEAIAMDPKNVIAHHNRGAAKLTLAVIYKQMGRNSQASKYYDEVRRELRGMAEPDPYLCYVLYRFEKTCGYHDEAAEDLKIGARTYFKESLELPKRFFASLLTMPRYLISSPSRF